MESVARAWIEGVSRGVEALAVVVMVVLIAAATARWIGRSRRGDGGAYREYRISLGRALLVGLELLVAADIVRTVALDSTLPALAALAALVAVRTFLGWTLTVEVEGRWPWQKPEREE